MSLREGDLTEQAADAIVNAANERLRPDGRRVPAAFARVFADT